ncbi:hypothetical protein T492DRAFT_247444 [Pavlovales sp. CCMP2436]|nr:hypothetical protein T492DRAFT_247444 [Pavlovales sp. CCMP2436]
MLKDTNISDSQRSEAISKAWFPMGHRGVRCRFVNGAPETERACLETSKRRLACCTLRPSGATRARSMRSVRAIGSGRGCCIGELCALLLRRPATEFPASGERGRDGCTCAPQRRDGALEKHPRQAPGPPTPQRPHLRGAARLETESPRR